LSPRTTLILRQTLPIPLPKPFTHFPLIPNLVVCLIIPLIELTIVLFHVLGHILPNTALFIDIGRFPARAEGWSRFVGGLLFVVQVFVFCLGLILLLFFLLFLLGWLGFIGAGFG
jgi:hypothetical protein